MNPAAPTKKFLISRLSALGDTVCCLPAAVALKRGFPECRITWAVDPRFAGIVECCGSVDDVVRVSLSLKTVPTYVDRFDAALDLQGLLKSALCIARAKADRKVGYHWRREGASLFSSRVLPDPTSFHVVDQYVDVAREVGGQMSYAEFDLQPKPEDVAAMRQLLCEKGVEGRFVAINAGAGWPTKRWVPSSFGLVIDLLAEGGLTGVLIGGKGAEDLSVASEVASHCKTAPPILAGHTSVRELVALISLCSAHLGGDTGSAHIAAALSKPAVGLYSITKPQRSCPYGQIERCLYDPAGLDRIGPVDVYQRLAEALA